MRKIIFTTLLLYSCVVNAQEYPFKVLKVIDGDTVEISAPFLPQPLKPVLSLRLLGVDTPEKFPRAKCAKEAVLGAKATEFTKKVLQKDEKVKIFLVNWDKYGGRVLGRITVDDKDLTRMLIDNGLARPYDGKAKSNWCI